MEWALTKSCWMLLQKTISPQFISQAHLFNSRRQPFVLFFQYAFFFHFIFLFFLTGPFNFLMKFHLSLLSIFLKEFYYLFITYILFSISFDHHNLTNICIHAVNEWHRIFLFPFFNHGNTHTLAFRVILYVPLSVFFVMLMRIIFVSVV